MTAEALLEDLNTSSPATNNEPSHFDDLIGTAEAEEHAAEQTAISAHMLTKEQFRASFKGIHKMSASMSGIKSLALPNTRIDDMTADEIVDTIYETILDIPLLHQFLMPNNKWIGRGFVMLVYVQGMRGAVIDEMKARREVYEQNHRKPTANYDEVKANSKPKPKKKTALADGEVNEEQAATLSAGMQIEMGAEE